MKKALLFLFLFLNLITVFFILLSYFSVWIPPDKWWIPSLFGLAYPFFLLVNMLFVVFWLIFKPRYFWIPLVAVLLGWGFLSRYFQVSGKTDGSGEIKVVSYNVQHFSGKSSLGKKHSADEIVRFLEEEKADIICLQEVRLRKNTIFNLEQTVQTISTINHYQYARSSTTYGSVTMTRYPVVYMGEIRFKNSRNITIYTDVVIQGDTVRIYNVHLQSYHIDPNRYSVIDSPDITEEKDLREIREISIKYRSAVQMRAEQSRIIRDHVEKSPYPVILCGDFNDTPASFSYQRTRGNLKDAFVESGRGIGRTYIGKLPSFRIDYIFHSNDFESFGFQTLDFRFSDHLPVTCELVKKRN
ncbi:MAG: hypothetical protein EOM73_01245 [Bacteroidia bacterium]|nr:hypothetical protein [Bacteroidia bacterium]